MKSKKTVWLVSVNAQPPEHDTHLRHRKFAEMLTQKGYDVVIFGGSFLHYAKFNLINDSRKYITPKYQNIQYVFFKVPSYSSNGIKRMLSIFLFAWRLFYYRKKFIKPDIIVHNIHVPFDLPVYFAAKRLKSRYVTEVWDLWPEAFVSTGLVKRSNPLLKLAFNMERFLYEKADKLIFTMEGGKDYIIEKGWDIAHGGKIDINKYHYINNGIDLDEFEYNKKNYIIQDNDLSDNSHFKVIYLGSIRLVNNVQQLIDAAACLQNNPKIKFLIYGDGDERERLIDYCTKYNINNVIFKEKWVDIKYVPYILSCSSLNLLNYKKVDTQKYGGSQGKLFQYLASGKPILSNNMMGYDIVNKHHAGISKNISSAQEYAEIINEFASLDQEKHNTLCTNALNTARFFDYKYLFKAYFKLINELL
ncbi:glycosyltransferase family 4 protein [Gabonibacter chumensis]|uniref:glycosyltransferase family 4 protein n=1 Tax=Gabonibacter chumensis TaxID=2972474 RepID=UPI002573075F|nr:glycosyltransferase family 4 protein [Gabonibacter chumensis]MCR9012827.1 glycosyltransferase family 4 protein [Gabonibacter chumensis]